MTTTPLDLLRQLVNMTCKPPGDAGKVYEAAQEMLRQRPDEVKNGKPACIHLFNHGSGAAAGVRVHQTGIDRFAVLYGLQERKGLNYAQAAHEFGECVFHALACDSKLDNSERGED